MNISERIAEGKSANPNIDSKVNASRMTKDKRDEPEAMHTFQYFLVRQKTPPAIPNRAEMAMSRLNAK